jgi:nitroreductase
MINDFGTLLGLGLLFPSGRATGPWRFVVRALAGTVVVLMLAGAFCAGPLDNTAGVPNPLGIPGTAWLYSLVGAVGYPVVLLGGVVALLARVLLAAVRPGPCGRRVAGYVGGMVLAAAGGFVWMAAHSAQPGQAVTGWTGFTVGLAAMLVIGAVGVARSPGRLG